MRVVASSAIALASVSVKVTVFVFVVFDRVVAFASLSFSASLSLSFSVSLSVATSFVSLFGDTLDDCVAWVTVMVVTPFSVDALTRAPVVPTTSTAEIAAALDCNRSARSFASMVLSFPVHCLNAPRSGALLARRYIRRVLRQTLVLWPYLVTAVVVL